MPAHLRWHHPYMCRTSARQKQPLEVRLPVTVKALWAFITTDMWPYSTVENLTFSSLWLLWYFGFFSFVFIFTMCKYMSVSYCYSDMPTDALPLVYTRSCQWYPKPISEIGIVFPAVLNLKPKTEVCVKPWILCTTNIECCVPLH